MNDLFMEIFDKYQKDVYRLIYSYTLNIQDTEDILQRTFIKLYRNIDKFSSSNEDVKKWLFRVAINDSKNLLKAMCLKIRVNIDDYENVMSVDKENNDLLKALNHVGIKYRVPLYLFYFEGYSIKEVAELMKLSETCVKTRLKRGKEKLKEEMEGE